MSEAVRGGRVHALSASPGRRKRSALTVLRVIVMGYLVGCGAYHNLPANWHQDLPGIYEGNSSGFREMVEFKSDGTFQHEVFEGDRSLCSESGKWSSSQGRFVVKLDRFTEFYDPMTDTFSQTGKKAIVYYFYPLPDGNTFTKISADVEFNYTLIRTDELPRN